MQSRDMLKDACGLRAFGLVGVAFHARGDQEKRFPIIVLCDGFGLLQDLMKTGDLVSERQDGIQFLTDDFPFLFHFFRPWKCGVFKNSQVFHCSTFGDEILHKVSRLAPYRHSKMPGRKQSVLSAGSRVVQVNVCHLALMHVLSDAGLSGIEMIGHRTSSCYGGGVLMAISNWKCFQ